MENTKIKLPTNAFFYPIPTVILGTKNNEKVNFMEVGWITRINGSSPSYFAMSIEKRHYTTQNILKNKEFSLSVPGTNLLVETDYCGIVSGTKTDKSKIFEIFYGSLKAAPLIKNCPISMECKLIDIVEIPTDKCTLFIGEIINVYSEEKYLTDGKLDFKKVDPLILTMPDNTYWSMGGKIGKAWSDGKKYESMD